MPHGYSTCCECFLSTCYYIKHPLFQHIVIQKLFVIRVKNKVFTSLIDLPSTHRVPGHHILTNVSGTRWCPSLPTPGQIEIPTCAITRYLTSCSCSKGHSFLCERCTLLGEFRPPALSLFPFLSDNLCFLLNIQLLPSSYFPSLAQQSFKNPHDGTWK